MTDNVLYGAATDEQLKHRTLTVEKAAAERQGQFGQRFAGRTPSPQLMTEPGDGGEGAYTGRCCGVCLMLVLVLVVAFIAVAALVLTIMFRVYPVRDCSTGSTCKSVSLSPPSSLSCLSLYVSLTLSSLALSFSSLFCDHCLYTLKLLFSSFIISCSVL